MTELPFGATIATEIRRYRLAKGWSIRRLAEECAALGMPSLTEPSLGNIERGQDVNAKRTQRRVLAEELPVIAKALGVAPVLLLFPVLRQDTVETLPGVRTDTQLALAWFTGRGPHTAERAVQGLVVTDTDREQWRRSAAILKLAERHDSLEFDLRYHLGNRERDAGVPDAVSSLTEQGIARCERELREVRDSIRAIPDARLPPLHPDVTYIDNPDETRTRTTTEEE